MDEVEMKFKEGDRVRRIANTGPVGTVTKVRVERTRATVKDVNDEPPAITVSVLWDNGTFSHFVPDGLEAAK